MLGFCPVGNLCIFRHGDFSLTARPSEPAPAPIRSQARAPKASPQLRFVDPVPSTPQSSGTSNQQTKSKKKKKQNEKREETGGPNSLSTNASPKRGKSKKQDEKSRKVTIRVSPRYPVTTERAFMNNGYHRLQSANGGQTWTLDLTFLTQRSKALENMFEDTTNKLRGLVRHRESNTLELDGVEAGHFSLFLSALRAGSRFDFSLDELKIILPLANDWGFSKLRNRCMTTIQTLQPSPVYKLLLARRSKIPDWIREAYLTLAIRTPGLKTADAQALGATAMSIIARAREEILLHRLQSDTSMQIAFPSLPRSPLQGLAYVSSQEEAPYQG
ncbi:hypothetical protein M407DRAFT_10449 [Tulasnella calospora MUT 4182]|uniref:BTB domain-containing protein n=1 Tax=Tulasnella calospora MUT 4182 TaxID=1051891 RepID=A0A0C3KIG9_9AGAM|nr:hypothetical protein M407DRAFT_10449 [Tulasnella calospora MUT 4182]